MLIEIQSDVFKSNGKVRPPIRFNAGLNTILGGLEGDNSIGKSTFLQIIDFTFGGSTYLKSDAVTKVEPHTINFTFQFNGKNEYFARRTTEKDIVYCCDADYNTKDKLSIDDFTAHLFSSYQIPIPDLSFRDMVGLYFRMQGKGNLLPNRPLSIVPNESATRSIIRLEKIFNVYWKIKEYERLRNEADDKKKAYSKVLRLELIPNATTTAKQRNDNLKQITELKSELNSITLDADQNVSIENLSKITESSEITAQILTLKRRLSQLNSQLAVVNINVENKSTIKNDNLDEFEHFFPMADIRSLEDIQRFHHKITTVLNTELADEAQRLSELVSATKFQITNLENKVRQLGATVNIPQETLDKISEVTSKIGVLEKQNETYETNKMLKDAYKSAKEQLAVAQSGQLESITAEINQNLQRINESFPENKFSPILEMESDVRYRYYTPDDDGTGSAWKALILFDYVILQSTALPSLAHDSLMLKNIEDPVIDAIIHLYAQSQKQIFLAFDKEGSYRESTMKVLQDTAVLRLNKGGNELFGWQWSKN